MPVLAATSIASLRVTAPSRSIALRIAARARSRSAGVRPSASSRRIDHDTIRSLKSGVSQPKSSVGNRCTVMRITQWRMIERSSSRARSTSAAVSPFDRTLI